MSTIQTGIELKDQFSSVILDFASGMMAATNAAVNFQNAMNQNVSTNGLNNVHNEIQSVMNDMDELNQTANVPITPTVSMDAENIDIPDMDVQVTPVVTGQAQIDVPNNLDIPVNPIITEQPEIDVPDSLEVPVTADVVQQPQIDIPDMDVQGVQQFNSQIERTHGYLQRVQGIQQIINSESQNMGVLPDDLQIKIEGVNNRLLQMQEAMNQISQNPFDLPTEAVQAELASLQNRIRQTVQEQLELNETLSNMDIEIEQPPPVEIPVVWQTEPLDVFTSSGVERFQQEVQSANSMLERLSDTQNEIARQAAATNVLPSSAFQDMNRLAVRIDNVRERIQQIENNHLNMGTDRANVELERLRSQLSQAVQQQNNLNIAIDRMDVSGANAAYLQLSQTIGNTEAYIRDNVNEQVVFNDAINNGAKNAHSLIGTIKSAIAAYATVNTVKSALNASDELTQTTSRLNMMNDGLQSTQDLVNMVYVAAQDSRGSFIDMASVVARFGNNAKDAFSSTEEVVQFAGLVQKQMTIAGASTQEASNAMLQLSQALGSGVLRGDELNSIFEQAPNLIMNIADYLNVPIGKIREMAADGELSADIVKNAIFAATDEINANFESIPMTWGQLWQSMQNTALNKLQPILDKINKLANNQEFIQNLNRISDFAIGIVSAIMDACVSAVNVLGPAIDQIGNFISGHGDELMNITSLVVGIFVAWQIVTGVIGFASTAVGVFQTVVGMARAAVSLFGMTAALAFGVIGIIAIVGTIIAVMSLIDWFKETQAATKDTGSTIQLAFAKAQVAIKEFDAAFTLVTGSLEMAWNTMCLGLEIAFRTVYGIILGIVWMICDGVREAINIAIDLLNEFIKTVNYIPSVSIPVINRVTWTAVDDIGNMAKEQFNAIYDSTLEVDKKNQEIADKIVAKQSAADQARADYDKLYANLTKNNKQEDKGDEARNLAKSLYTTAKNTGDTAKAAQKAAQSLDVTGENLKYIKDLAERDYINRFTTARINVKQTNHNTVKNNMDLDGINEYLRSDLEQRMAATAEGVH